MNKEVYRRSYELISEYSRFTDSIRKRSKSQITIKELFDLKSVLSNVHNILTSIATLATANKISEILSFNEEQKLNLISSVEETKANTNGFDIKIDDPNKILVEVKCNMLLHDKKLGQQQINSILNDAIKLRNEPPKRRKIDFKTDDYIKVIVLVDSYHDKLDAVIKQITKEVKCKENTRETRKERTEIKPYIKPLSSLAKIKNMQDTAYIYLTTISTEDMENELQRLISKGLSI